VLLVNALSNMEYVIRSSLSLAAFSSDSVSDSDSDIGLNHCVE